MLAALPNLAGNACAAESTSGIAPLAGDNPHDGREKQKAGIGRGLPDSFVL
jgi:hypothetical protein